MKAWHIKLTGLSLALVLLSICAEPANSQDKNALWSGIELPAEGRTVIMGTWLWDIESNTQGRTPNVDLWWQQVGDGRQFIVPKRSAGLLVLYGYEFETVDIETLKNLKYRNSAVENTKLEPNALLAVKTVEGNFAKMRVVGYRDSHDFSFSDTKFAWDGWLPFLQCRPNLEKYHLEVEWKLFPGEVPEL